MNGYQPCLLYRRPIDQPTDRYTEIRSTRKQHVSACRLLGMCGHFEYNARASIINTINKLLVYQSELYHFGLILPNDFIGNSIGKRCDGFLFFLVAPRTSIRCVLRLPGQQKLIMIMLIEFVVVARTQSLFWYSIQCHLQFIESITSRRFFSKPKSIEFPESFEILIWEFV